MRSRPQGGSPLAQREALDIGPSGPRITCWCEPVDARGTVAELCVLRRGYVPRTGTPDEYVVRLIGPLSSSKRLQCQGRCRTPHFAG